ncbi:MAG: 4'-phosphopantetheinyl transferase [Deltaproteobacteria bacterium]|nr:holo-ACP synthase [Deltaproteobacteria bacterium]HDH86458.1 holo-ACP synthase [Desulfobacteraceae bacterium]MBW2104664.1 holo-ACP synthase [Deltaproteobacteria bacterium]MBW2332604.1 holo-ACP synthase [Deltaproteobacteria bacterium]RLB17996.1 MAG: 4'-phosphopantetheinyl transferase [Deltaproteobacteria bacterium]
MIYGIGVDLVNIRRMGRVIDRWGARFLRRVFTEQEINFCLQAPKSESSLALRFAAKEAFSKAIGLGMRNGIRWHDIEIVHNEIGRPDLNLTGKALSFCHAEGIISWYVSLSDDGDYSIAVVALEKRATG